MNDLDRAILATYQTARACSDDRFIDTTLEALGRYVPFDSARWATATVTPTGVVFHTPHLIHEVPDWDNRYDEVRSMDVPAKYVLDHLGTTANFHFRTILKDPGHSALLDYTKKVRHANALITAHKDLTTGHVLNIALFGANSDRQYSDHERRFVEILYPHLMEAWAVNQSLQLCRYRSRNWSVAICIPPGIITLCEPAFTDVLRAEWCTGHNRYVLPEVLMKELQSGAQSYRGQHVVFRFERRTEFALVRARLATSVDLLTEREREVAHCVASGLTHKEVARRMGIAPATVRNHLQAIHRRVGARNNAELATLLQRAEV
ncbi:response regulator transcription factor [Paraburkholderia youngii]|uniref:response regulator transcription factor n=1 Tax=Paraburkholderia youngii TaxID=2782701 RepID=UPI003D1F4E04